jgi:hypothetical protein
VRRVLVDLSLGEANMLINLLDVQLEQEQGSGRGFGRIAERVRDRIWNEAYAEQERSDDWEAAVAHGYMDNTEVDDDD